MRGNNQLGRVLATLAAGALVTAATPAATRADALDKVTKRIINLEAEVLELEKTIAPPKSAASADEKAQRRLLDGQVAHGMGNYDDAALLLYDVVEHHPTSRAYPDALFFLADSLYMRGDLLSARDYFRKVVYEQGEGDPNYQKAIERLLELSLKLKDDEGVPDLLARLDRIPEGRKADSAPYVRAKYAYFKGDFDAAIKIFDTIPQSSNYYFQARYFLGASYIAKDDLALAAKVFSDLLKVPTKNAAQKRIIELTYMALGRIHYERDQPDEAIDAYLMVSRKSDLFDDALYEVAFVYVKARQFDKALRALELLELATGGSCADAKARVNTVVLMPEICILKGNLNVRKGQSLVDTDDGDPTEDYVTALDIFENTRKAYQGPRDQLEEVIKANEDPKKYFAAVVLDQGFDTDAAIPDVARKWIRDDPEVARVVAVQADLEQIRKDLDDTAKLIARLERAVDSPNRVQLFPQLAEKYGKVVNILDEVNALRLQLVNEEAAIYGKYASASDKAELERLRARRQEITKQLASMPNAGATYEQRIEKAKAAYDALDKQAKELEVAIGALEAELAAIEKFYNDTAGTSEQKFPREQFEQQRNEIKAEIAAFKKELELVRAELALAIDEAGVDDDLAEAEKRLRKELAQVTKQEHALMKRAASQMSGGDASRVRDIDAMMVKLEQIEAGCARIVGKIEKIVDTELAEVKVALAQEKQTVIEYQAQLAEYEAENLEVGSEVIKGSFGNVSKKFREIVLRADVGIIDVNWAEKEEAETRFDRIEKDSAREKRTLENEFSEVAHEEEDAPAPPPAGGGAADDEKKPEGDDAQP